jgi:hypothetical protein
MDILNLSVMILLNSSQKDLLVEEKIISSTYIWHTNNFFHFSTEESRIGLTNTKTIANKKIPNAFIPYSWYLLKPVERLMKFINMVMIFFTFKAGWLLHIHLFFDWTIQEGTLDVRLIKFKAMVSSIGK